jgi:hypothetical protein
MVRIETIIEQKRMDASPFPIIGLTLIFVAERKVVDQKPASLSLFFCRRLDTMHIQILVLEGCYNLPPITH